VDALIPVTRPSFLQEKGGGKGEKLSPSFDKQLQVGKKAGASQLLYLVSSGPRLRRRKGKEGGDAGSFSRLSAPAEGEGRREGAYILGHRLAGKRGKGEGRILLSFTLTPGGGRKREKLF